jgi:hypothetical protein
MEKKGISEMVWCGLSILDSGLVWTDRKFVFTEGSMALALIYFELELQLLS